jgi:hypothetical protein
MDLPRFTPDEWVLLGKIKQLLQPIFEATKLLEDRNASISVIIPLFQVIK